MAVVKETEKLSLSVCCFTGKIAEWPDWRARVEGILQRMRLRKLISGEESRPTEGSTERSMWDDKNNDLYAVLLQCTKDSASQLVRQHQRAMDGVSAWKALVEKYEDHGTLGKVAVMSKLMESSLGEYEDPDLFTGRMEQYRSQLEGMTREVTAEVIDILDTLMLGLILTKLPDKYEPLITTISAQTDMTYEKAKEQLRTFYMRNIAKDNAKTPEDNALVGNTMFKGYCLKCGEVVSIYSKSVGGLVGLNRQCKHLKRGADVEVVRSSSKIRAELM